jgi:hypothetical protein
MQPGKNSMGHAHSFLPSMMNSAARS